MRVNLTKKEIINSVFMQIGFSKKMSESILEDILSDIVENLKGVESFSIFLNEDKSFTKVFSSGFPKN